MEGKTSHEVIEKSTVSDSIQYLKTSNDVNLIICDMSLPDGSGSDIYKYIREKNIDIPFILMTGHNFKEEGVFKNFFNDNKHNAYISKPFDFNRLTTTVSKVLDTDLPTKKTGHCKIKINKLLMFNNICCDLFIRLSEIKFVKIIKRDEMYSKEILDKYLQKGVRYVWIKEKDFENFTNDYSDSIKLLLESEKLTDKDRIESELNGTSAIHNMVLKLGIEEHVVSAINSVVNSGIRAIKKNGNLFTFLKRAIKRKEYIYEHSLLTSYLSGAIAIKLNWCTTLTLQKLWIASILHDVLLGSSHLAQVYNLEDISLEYLNQKDVEKIKQHPLKTAEMIREAKVFPHNVSDIVLSHHETVDGTGFPRGLKARQISQLSCIFIIAEDLANTIYDEEFDEHTINKIINDFSVKYNKGNFKKPLKGLLQVFPQKTF